MKLPNEGDYKPCEVTIEAEKGFEVNITAPCTLTFIKQEGKNIHLEVSDLKYELPPELKDLGEMSKEEHDYYMNLPDI